MTRLLFAILFLVFVSDLQAQNGNPPPVKEPARFDTDTPATDYDIILGRPTDHSICLSLHASLPGQGYIRYGEDSAKLQFSSAPASWKKEETITILLEKLAPGKKYFYRLVQTAEHPPANTSINSFVTQKPGGQFFRFCVQADSHLDENASTGTYLQTLVNIKKEQPDFLIDLGDTWMTDKYQPDYHEAFAQYKAQRYYFSRAGDNVPVFFTLGNHDGEAGGNGKKNGGAEMREWATRQRTAFYSNPVPVDFYKGNSEKEPGTGFPQNYYAWEWGDALFIVLDPFRYSTGNKSPWQRTLGQTQYLWLKKTLEESRARFKFVFIHNLVGGVDKKGKGRGGAEASRYYEWGGYDTSGVNRFAENRPGWAQPIHDLLVANHVNIVFHGHDHFFAKQEKDGIIYQLVPQPGATHYGNTNLAADYGYHEGTLLNTPGYLRVSVNKLVATVDYIQTSTDNKHKNGEVLFSYSIKADK